MSAWNFGVDCSVWGCKQVAPKESWEWVAALSPAPGYMESSAVMGSDYLLPLGSSFLISALPKGDGAYLFVFLFKKNVFFLMNSVVTHSNARFIDSFWQFKCVKSSLTNSCIILNQCKYLLTSKSMVGSNWESFRRGSCGATGACSGLCCLLIVRAHCMCLCWWRQL